MADCQFIIQRAPYPANGDTLDTKGGQEVFTASHVDQNGKPDGQIQSPPCTLEITVNGVSIRKGPSFRVGEDIDDVHVTGASGSHVILKSLKDAPKGEIEFQVSCPDCGPTKHSSSLSSSGAKTKARERKSMWLALFALGGVVLGGLIGGLLGGPIGALIGEVVGLIVGAIAGLIVPNFWL